MFFSDAKRKQVLYYILVGLLANKLFSFNVGALRVKKEAKTDTNVARSFRINATNLKCEHTVPNVIEFFECQLTWRNNRSYSSGSLVLRKPISKLKADVVLDIYQANGRLVNVFNKTVDCCAILSTGKHGLKIFDTFLNVMFATVNERPTCPLKAHFNYTITDFNVPETFLPAYIPKAKFRSGLYLSTSGRRAARVVVLGKVLNSV
ncbi:uncharacterized protein LOC109579411 [Bactrocera dorsalis]|uniref:Uncharacterized protein LOC109579411 n=1 Tax=Bactrocera dorsalis TaxID=27457 RepID=A0A6J0RHT0_BACDO|nr:uncharacterized protein LOC109579411 [Bactrocera dorsalis]